MVARWDSTTRLSGCEMLRRTAGCMEHAREKIPRWPSQPRFLPRMCSYSEVKTKPMSGTGALGHIEALSWQCLLAYFGVLFGRDFGMVLVPAWVWFVANLFTIWVQCWIQFGSSLGPICVQFWFNFRSSLGPVWVQTWDQNCVLFGSNFRSSLGPVRGLIWVRF